MNKHLLLMLTTVLTVMACGRSEGYLHKTPEPPPPPPRYNKTYKFDLNLSERASKDVDIIWVIDNSGSMSDKQQNVIANSDKFMRAFTSSTTLHWRMGLISTSLYEQPYLGFKSIVDWNTPDAVAQFNAAVASEGTNGDSNEQSFQPTLNALHQYSNWLRPGAFLVQIVVSDEVEDESDRSNVSVDSYVSQIEQLMKAKDRFVVFGIFSFNSTFPRSNYPGKTRYADVVAKTGGKTYDIYSPDYGTLLAQLGADLVARTSSVDPVILLDQKPKPDTIVVAYRGRVLRPGPKDKGGEWSYDPQDNLIRIHDSKIIDSRVLDVNVSFEMN